MLEVEMVRGGRLGMMALVVWAGCGEEPPVDEAPDPYDVTVGPFEVSLRYTDHGVPHITADDHGSLAYGMGWALARDHACVLADQIVKVRSERARYFGAGPDDLFVHSDFGWLGLRVRQDAEEAWFGLSDIFQDALIGYAAGYSRYIAEEELPPACADAPWVKPIDHIDLLSYMLALGLDGSGAVFVQDVGAATPPGSGQSPPPPPTDERLAEIALGIRDPKRGSNGWALGSDRTTTGRGMILSNTHFPAVGEKQWHESHLTIPGELDVYGVSLVGVPIINMGFNRHVAWTHTVSFTPRFIGYFHPLEPGDPTSYQYDGGVRQMEATEVSIEVRGADGELSTRTKTLYRTHQGPVINAPLLGWTEDLAVSFRDVNARNLGLFDVWYGMNKADSLDAFVAAHRDTQAIPWVYTIAADAEGEVFFGDTSRAPNLSPEAIDAWQASLETDFIAQQFASFGVIGVDGSDPLYEWVEDPDAAVPGLIPFDEAPVDRRRDYVFNANDSHWLHHADDPLTGFREAIYGDERTPRSARTRMNGRYLAETGPGTASGEDGLFSLEELEAAALSMRSSIADAALPAVVERCTGEDEIRITPSRTIDITEACDVLAAWDGTFTTDAVGAVLFRELLGSSPFEPFALNDDGGGLFVEPFDPDDPLNTPAEVVPAPEPEADGAVESDPVLRALGLAVARLTDEGHGVDVALGDLQFMAFSDNATEIGIPGGQYWEGTIGIADYSTGPSTTLLDRYFRGELVNDDTELTADGYPVNNGNSWILAMGFTDDGPEARAVMTYGQSEDPASPYYDDQTSLYASGTLRDVAFEDDAIEAALVEEITLTGP